MAKIVWDQTGERLYETGVDRGVLYVQKADGSYDDGVAWNGLTAVTESPSGAEATALYADNIKYLNLISAEEFGATVEAFTYPDEFMVCDGSISLVPGVVAGQQNRRPFGLTFRTLVGNDTLGQEFGYKIHLIYNALASTSERGYQTVNDSPEAITFSWELTTTPVPVTIMIGNVPIKPCASIVIDSTKVDPDLLEEFEEIIYGTTALEAQLPDPDAVYAHFTSAAG